MPRFWLAFSVACRYQQNFVELTPTNQCKNRTNTQATQEEIEHFSPARRDTVGHCAFAV